MADDAPVNFIPLSECLSESFDALQPPQTYNLKAPKTGSYLRCYMSYNRGTAEQPALDEPLFELAICKGTVEEKPNEDGSFGYQLKLTIKDERDQAGFDRMYLGMLNVAFKYKGQFGQAMATIESLKGTLKNPLYRIVDKMTGQLVANADPISWLKFDAKKTRFTHLRPRKEKGPDGNVEYDQVPIDYKQLVGKELEVSVIINTRDLYKGSTLSPQIFVRSCIILDMNNAGHVEHEKSGQLAEYLKAKAADPRYMDDLNEKFEKLKAQGPRTSTTPGASNSLLTAASASSSSVPPGFPTQQTQHHGPSTVPQTPAPQYQQFIQQPPQQLPFGVQMQQQPQQFQMQMPGQVPQTPGQPQFQQPQQFIPGTGQIDLSQQMAQFMTPRTAF